MQFLQYIIKTMVQIIYLLEATIFVLKANINEFIEFFLKMKILILFIF